MNSIPDKDRAALAKSITGDGTYADYQKSLHSTSSIQKLAASITDSGVYADYMKSLDNTRSIQKMAKSITGGGAYADYLKSHHSTSSIQKLAASITDSGVYADYLKSLDNTSSIQKLAKSITGGGAYADYLKSLHSTSSIQKLAASITDSGVYADYLKSLDNTSSIQKMAKSITGGGAYADYLKSRDNTSSIQKLAKSITGGGAYADYLKSLHSTSSIQKRAKSIADNSAFYASVERLSQSKYLDNLFAEFASFSDQNVGFDESTVDFEEHDAIDLVQELASAESQNSFDKILEKSPGWLKWVLVSFLVHVVWNLLIGAASGVIGNLITPYVQAYLDETQSTTQREQVKGLRRLSFSEFGIELRSYRFITATTLHLRATPNARAPIVGELKFGQVVGVLSSNLDWTEVLYEYGDGSTTTGWVFTRYTAKFRS